MDGRSYGHIDSGARFFLRLVKGAGQSEPRGRAQKGAGVKWGREGKYLGLLGHRFWLLDW